FWCLKEITNPSKCNFCLNDHRNDIRDTCNWLLNKA
ncbi:hypothetical protein A2U01_0069299, partial [Trifolium medium]|nr:hypothetical protein [Trifolium medium]